MTLFLQSRFHSSITDERDPKQKFTLYLVGRSSLETI